MVAHHCIRQTNGHNGNYFSCTWWSLSSNLSSCLWFSHMDFMAHLISKESVSISAMKFVPTLELSWKPLKNSCFGREFRPTFDIVECLRSVQVVLETPILVKQRGDVWLWTSFVHIKMNSLSNFGEHHLRCLQKFAMKVIFIEPFFGWSQMPPLHSTIPLYLGVPKPLEHSNIIRCQRGDETPYQNKSFWEALRMNLLMLIFNTSTFLKALPFIMPGAYWSHVSLVYVSIEATCWFVKFQMNTILLQVCTFCWNLSMIFKQCCNILMWCYAGNWHARLWDLTIREVTHLHSDPGGYKSIPKFWHW